MDFGVAKDISRILQGYAKAAEEDMAITRDFRRIITTVHTVEGMQDLLEERAFHQESDVGNGPRILGEQLDKEHETLRNFVLTHRADIERLHPDSKKFINEYLEVHNLDRINEEVERNEFVVELGIQLGVY